MVVARDDVTSGGDGRALVGYVILTEGPVCGPGRDEEGGGCGEEEEQQRQQKVVAELREGLEATLPPYMVRGWG